MNTPDVEKVGELVDALNEHSEAIEELIQSLNNYLEYLEGASNE